MYKYWIIVRTLLIEEMTNKNKEFITNKSNVCNYEYMVEDKMVIEYLPILEQKDNKILTIGKIDRTKGTHKSASFTCYFNYCSCTS